MHEAAYTVLSAIDRGDAHELSTTGDWLTALQTIRWAQMTTNGIVLTAAGRQALQDMEGERAAPLSG